MNSTPYEDTMWRLVSGCHPVFSFKALTQPLNLIVLFMADLICHVEENVSSVTGNIGKNPQ